MAETIKFHQLDPAGAAQGTDIIPIERPDGLNYGLLLSAIQTFINNGIQPTLDSYLLKSGGTMTGSLILSRDGVLPYEAVNVQQLKAVEMGLTPKMPCRYITLSNLDATYNNGTNGVGATLTGNSNGALSIDNPAITPALNNRIVVRAQTNAAQNGIYTLTQIGSAGSPYILTRATDYDESAEIFAGTYTQITQGSAAGNMYVLSTTGTIVVGTTPLIFYQFNMIVAGAGLKKEGTTISIDNTVTPGSAGTASQVSQFTVDESGLITAYANVAISILASQVSDFTAAVKAVVNSFLFSVIDVTATTLILSATNSNQYIRMKNGGTITLPTVDSNILLGMRWNIVNLSATPVTFVPGSGNSIVGTTTLNMNQSALIILEQTAGGNIFRIFVSIDVTEIAQDSDVYSNTQSTGKVLSPSRMAKAFQFDYLNSTGWFLGEERVLMTFPKNSGGVCSIVILNGAESISFNASFTYTSDTVFKMSINPDTFKTEGATFPDIRTFLANVTFKIYKVDLSNYGILTMTLNKDFVSGSFSFYIYLRAAGAMLYNLYTPQTGKTMSEFSALFPVSSASVVTPSQSLIAQNPDIYNLSATSNLINGVQLLNLNKFSTTITESWTSGQERFMCAIPYSSGGIFTFYVLYPGVSRFGFTAQISFADTNQINLNIIKFEGDNGLITSLSHFLSNFSFKCYRHGGSLTGILTITCTSSILPNANFSIDASLSASKSFYTPFTPYTGQLMSSVPSSVFSPLSAAVDVIPDIFLLGSNFSATLDALFSTAEGALIRRGASSWEALPPGTEGQTLRMGASSVPQWQSVPVTNAGAFHTTIPSPVANTAYSLVKIAGFVGTIQKLIMYIETGTQLAVKIYKNGAEIAGYSYQALPGITSYPIAEGNTFVATDSLQIYVVATSGSPTNLNVALAYSAG